MTLRYRWSWVFYQLSYQANWELIRLWVRDIRRNVPLDRGSWYALFMCDTFFSPFIILDSIISKQEYLEYQKDSYRKLLGMEMPGYRVTLEEDTFTEMDRNDTGVIDWWEFMIPMCDRKLTERKKVIVWVCYDDKKILRVGYGGLADLKKCLPHPLTPSLFDAKL